MNVPATTSQTVGPYYSIGLAYRNSDSVCTEATPGEHIEISGQVFDGAGNPVPDGQLEVWQSDSEGHFAGFDSGENTTPSAGFAGFARIPLDPKTGAFRFLTVRPGSVAGQASHIVVLLSMRGILKHLITRIYFADDSLNSADPVLSVVPKDRQKTLLAHPPDSQSQAASPQKYLWDIRLQGDDETVFFAY